MQKSPFLLLLACLLRVYNIICIEDYSTVPRIDCHLNCNYVKLGNDIIPPNIHREMEKKQYTKKDAIFCCLAIEVVSR